MNFSCHYYSHLWIILTIVNYPLKVNTTKKYSEIHDNWIGYDATQNLQTNPISSSESPLLIIVYIFCDSSVHSKCASGAYTCSNLYILKLASPALTSFDAFLPGRSTVDVFPFIGLLPLFFFFFFFQGHTSRIYKYSYHWWLRTIFFFLYSILLP